MGTGFAGGVIPTGVRTRAAATLIHVFVVTLAVLARVRLVGADGRPSSIVVAAANAAPPVLSTASIVAVLAASAAGPIVAGGVVDHISSHRATVRSQVSVIVTANCERLPGGDARGIDRDRAWAL